jgi:hypothetical protein
VPVGQARPHQRSDFGKLPNAWEQAAQGNTPAVALPFRQPERTAPASVAVKPVSLTPSRARELAPVKESNASKSTNGSKTANGNPAESITGEPGAHRKRRKRHRRHRRSETKILTFRNVLLTCGAVALAIVFVYLLVRGDGPSLPPVNVPEAPAPAK